MGLLINIHCIQRAIPHKLQISCTFGFKQVISLRIMMNTKKLLKMAKKWQQRAALHRKRISFQRSSTSTRSSTAVEKGCFVVYTADGSRFAFPLSYLSNTVFQELLKIAEEEFGLPTGGPITLPFDSVFMEYLIKLMELRMDGDTERALLMSIPSARSSVPCSLQQQQKLFVI
ncbi:unnamed protein product [Eruca vesicaria subsp. sativa]|uniref:Uncharacterized protein n=1 Tax=Eruca vesicaria subsp. sativa TaxID=29727 RepID=A0ABC8K490_ERUVS|nr:unnamed protein product [Eruca vesicaria subsp. sativa]